MECECKAATWCVCVYLSFTWLVFGLWSGTCGGPCFGIALSGSGPGLDRPSWIVCPGSDSWSGCLTDPERRSVSYNV